MKLLKDLPLLANQRQALDELRRRLMARPDVVALVLYGSAARGTADPESDQDVLVVTTHTLTRWVRHQITDLAFDVNLHYDTNISTLVVDRQSWETGALSILPLHQEILRDGVAL
jgi:predicted nucleotidyltransferase